MRGPIVVGADGSDNSRLAIDEAASIAKGSGQTVVVAFVRYVRLAGLGVPWTGALSVGVVEEMLTTDESFAEAQSIAILDPVGVPGVSRCGRASPHSELMRLATEVGAEHDRRCWKTPWCPRRHGLRFGMYAAPPPLASLAAGHSPTIGGRHPHRSGNRRESMRTRGDLAMSRWSGCPAGGAFA